MRHGHSPTASESGVAKDFDRPLSAEGRAGARRSAARLAADGGRPALILHSPLVRAAQTARVAAEAFSPRPAVEEFEPLSNALAPEALLERLRPRLDATAELLAVGHQPQLGELAALLSGQIVDFKPGGMVVLELGDAKAAVVESWNPQDLPAA